MLSRSRFLFTVLVPFGLAIAPAPAASADHVPVDSLEYRHRLSASWSLETTERWDEDNDITGRVSYRRDRSGGFGWTLDARISHVHQSDQIMTWGGMPSDFTRWMLCVGPGIRVRKSTSPVRPFFQANAWLVTEHARSETAGVARHSTQHGPGMGAAFGLDIVLSPRVELPLALRYDRLFRQRDIAFYGVEAGVSFGLGRAP